MKLSLNWIKEYVKIPNDMDLSRLAYDLTMSTVEVEGVLELASKFDNMVVGVVKEVFPHPNADRLKVCKTDIGNDEVRDIVCGGINLTEGMKVAVARPGAKARWHGAGELVEIGNVKLRGVESYGMICAASEIGLSELFPSTEEAEILDLSAFGAKAGEGLADALGLNDVILEIDNKSISNRPDLWGHYGIAREVAALYNLPLMDFEAFVPPNTPDFTINVEDTQRCPRYIAVRIEGLSVKPSPFEMQSRIWRVGMRPINALVDITNYVMLATGQPTHAFDADNIEGNITVRRAKEAEELLLLNDQTLTLSTDDLVITDNKSALGLAGVMGGSKDSVLPETDKVILEIANFKATNIRRTAARYETRTEAATRYEKALDPERADFALSMAMGLFTELYPNIAVTGFRDIYPEPLKRTEIDVSLSWLEKRLGIRIPNEYITDKLGQLGFDVSYDKDTLHVVSPTWRSTGDVSIPDDIMEEIARMYGYERFDPKPITTSFDGAINQIKIDLDRNIKEYLAFRCGMQEVFTYPWMSDEYVEAVMQSTEGMLSLSTPPSPSESHIRSTLLPNICEAVSNNLRYFNEFMIFETAQVMHDHSYSAPYDAKESLPLELTNTAGALVGNVANVNQLFRRAKGIIEAMPGYVHMEPLTFDKLEKPVWADGVVWLNILHQGERVGDLALLSKKASLDCGIDNSSVLLFEFNMDTLKTHPSRTNEFAHLPGYPLVDYDVSMLFDQSVKWEEILNVIVGKVGADDLIQDVSFVDEYRGKQIPTNKKSVTFRVVIGSLHKTLTSEEIDSKANAIIERLKKSLGGELRN
ncbi:MAG: phenylalanine--tRNA ligase subunit beta [Peptostreptococcaceae bacterium]|nr:phenylalanine--tRNA ligase subunit beta [Peptostreptococcaceae bacterium]